MCGRYTNQYTWAELHALYSITEKYIRPIPKQAEPDWKPRFNIAPTTQVPVIIFEGGKRRIEMMRWGLVPAWSKEVGKFSTFNARDDGIEAKPMFRGAWKAGRRCIIPASSFFEWQKRGSDKQPFAIALGNKGPMAFAGLWEEWTPKGGEPMRSCTLITCAPNKLMAELHDRTPVILGEEDWPKWLGEEPATAAEICAMLKPFAAQRMTTWPVGKAVGSVKNQGPELTLPVEPSALKNA